MIEVKDEEVEDFKEVMVEPMEEVANLKMQYKIRERQNGKKNIL